MVFMISLSGALAIIMASVVFQMRQQAWRKSRLRGLELRPNCLLTRHPIAFINGSKSLFRLFQHWNEVPQYLREHGYDVVVIDPARGEHRRASVLEALDHLDEKCHIIADSSIESDLKHLAQSKHPKIASLTMISNAERPRKKTSSKGVSIEDLRPLDSAIEIFEIRASLERQPTRNLGTIVLALLSELHLMAHNWVHLHTPVDPIETADSARSQNWEIEAKFLDLAISLAERDTQWCD